jgi:hypothetical protein
MMEKYKQWCDWFFQRHGYLPTKCWVDSNILTEMVTLATPYKVPLSPNELSLDQMRRSSMNRTGINMMGIHVENR